MDRPVEDADPVPLSDDVPDAERSDPDEPAEGRQRSRIGQAAELARRLPPAVTILVCSGLLLQPIWAKAPVAAVPVLTFGRAALVLGALGLAVGVVRLRVWRMRPSPSTLMLLAGVLGLGLVIAISALVHGTVRNGGAFYGYVESAGLLLLLLGVASIHRGAWLPLLLAAAAGSLVSDIQALAAGAAHGARLSGEFGNPNYLAYATATGATILLASIPLVRRRWRLAILLALLLPLTTLALTYSRSGALTLAVGVFVLVVQRVGKHRVAIAALTGMVMIGGGFLAYPLFEHLRIVSESFPAPDKSGWDPSAQGPIPQGPSRLSNTPRGDLRVSADAAGSGVSYPIGSVRRGARVSATVAAASEAGSLPLSIGLEDNVRGYGLQLQTTMLSPTPRSVTVRWHPTADSLQARVYVWSPTAHARFVISQLLFRRDPAGGGRPRFRSLSLRLQGSSALVLGSAFERRAGRSRSESGKFAFRLFLHHPLTGVGWMRFGDYSRSQLGVYDAGAAHDQFLTIMAELGIPGLFFLFLSGGALAWRLLRMPLSRVQVAALAPLAAGFVGLFFTDAIVTTAVVLPPATAVAVLFASRPRTHHERNHKAAGPLVAERNPDAPIPV